MEKTSVTLSLFDFVSSVVMLLVVMLLAFALLCNLVLQVLLSVLPARQYFARELRLLLFPNGRSKSDVIQLRDPHECRSSGRRRRERIDLDPHLPACKLHERCLDQVFPARCPPRRPSRRNTAEVPLDEAFPAVVREHRSR